MVLDDFTKEHIPGVDDIDSRTMDLVADEIFDVFHRYGVKKFWWVACLRDDAMFFRGTIQPKDLFNKLGKCATIIKNRIGMDDVEFEESLQDHGEPNV